MTNEEREEIRSRLADLKVDSDWATATAIKLGGFAEKGILNLQTLLLFGLCIVDGCRSGLSPELFQEIEAIHKKVDAEADRKMNEARD